MATLESLEDAAPAKTGTDWGALVSNVVPGLVQARYMDKVLKENLKREKAGLPPLDIEQYQPGVKVGLDPQTRTLLWGGGIAVALLLMLLVYNSTRNKGARQ